MNFCKYTPNDITLMLFPYEFWVHSMICRLNWTFKVVNVEFEHWMASDHCLITKYDYRFDLFFFRFAAIVTNSYLISGLKPSYVLFFFNLSNFAINMNKNKFIEFLHSKWHVAWVPFCHENRLNILIRLYLVIVSVWLGVSAAAACHWTLHECRSTRTENFKWQMHVQVCLSRVYWRKWKMQYPTAVAMRPVCIVGGGTL